MKLIIAGSRNWEPTVDEIARAIKRHFPRNTIVTEVVSGCARGADRMGEQWARKHRIPVRSFHANWNAYGKSAGPIRNTQMADYGDCAIVFRRAMSAGSSDMIAKMEQRKKFVAIEDYPMRPEPTRRLL